MSVDHSFGSVVDGSFRFFMSVFDRTVSDCFFGTARYPPKNANLSPVADSDIIIKRYNKDSNIKK